MEKQALLDRVELALSQAKKVQRESKFSVQSLARIRDEVMQSKEAHDGSRRAEAQ